eukprot:m51a1_g12782 hypothetical protein (332) ;mRNA; f:2745-4118
MSGVDIKQFLTKERRAELAAFVDVCRRNPQVSPRDHPMPPAEEHAEEEHTEEHVEEEEEEGPQLEPDTELMQADNDPPLPVGDTAAPVSEEDRDAANAIKARALDAQNAGNDQEALALLTEAVLKNPQSAILYACRASVLLRMRRPNAAIRDCEAAIRLNPDSAKPYKVRGRAERHLGLYERARADLQLGNKLDYDDATYQTQKWVEARAKALEARAKARQQHHQQQHQQQQHEAKPESARPAGGCGGCCGGNAGAGRCGAGRCGGCPGAGGFNPAELMNDPEVAAAMADPATRAKLLEALGNPAKLAEASSDPKIAKIIERLAAKFGGAQ